MFNGYQDWLRKSSRKKTPPTMGGEDRPKSVDDSISGDTSLDTNGDPPVSEKNELTVSTLEAFQFEPESTEPWTPGGTNRRTDDIPEVSMEP